MNSIINVVLKDHALIVRTVDSVIGDNGTDNKVDSIPALMRAMSLGHVSSKALASRIKALATAMLAEGAESIPVAEMLVRAVAVWRSAIMTTTTAAKDKTDIRNSAGYAIKVLAKQTGTLIKWQDATQSYSVETAKADADTVISAAGTGSESAQDAVKVSQTGAGLTVDGEQAKPTPAEQVFELARHFSKAEFLALLDTIPAELFKQPKQRAKKSA